MVVNLVRSRFIYSLQPCFRSMIREESVKSEKFPPRRAGFSSPAGPAPGSPHAQRISPISRGSGMSAWRGRMRTVYPLSPVRRHGMSAA